MRPAISFLLLLMPMCASADVPADQRKEVEHLVNFIRSTDCQLERNDTFYTGEEAIVHILRKYDHYRDDIKSTEDFIHLSANKSLISGKSYIAHCKQLEPIRASEWLLTELSRYRNSIISR